MARFAPSGRRVWRKVWGESGAHSSALSEVTVGGAGVVAAGETGELTAIRGPILRRLNSDGALRVTLSAFGEKLRWGDVAVNAAGDVGLSGTSTSEGGAHVDHVHMRRPANGPPGSPLSFAGSLGRAYPRDVAITSGGVVISAGYLLNGASGYDLAVIHDRRIGSDWQDIDVEAGDQKGTGLAVTASAVHVGGSDGGRLSLWKYER